jgi:hypothetical protein
MGASQNGQVRRVILRIGTFNLTACWAGILCDDHAQIAHARILAQLCSGDGSGAVLREVSATAHTYLGAIG